MYKIYLWYYYLFHGDGCFLLIYLVCSLFKEPEIQIRKISRLGEGIVNEDGQVVLLLFNIPILFQQFIIKEIHVLL